MGKTYRVHMTPQAMDDLRNIRAYIARVLKEPGTAVKIYQAIKREIVSLREMPERCPKMDTEPRSSRGVRKLLVGNYIAFYLVDSETVHVIRIVYGGMDLAGQLEHK